MREHFKMKCFVILVCLFSTLANAGTFAGWFESLVSGVDCGKLLGSDVNQLQKDCVVCMPKSMSILDLKTSKNYNDILEQMYFNSESTRHVDQLACQINQCKTISQKSENLKQISKDIASKIPLLKELLQSHKKARLNLFEQGRKLREAGLVCIA